MKYILRRLLKTALECYMKLNLLRVLVKNRNNSEKKEIKRVLPPSFREP